MTKSFARFGLIVIGALVFLRPIRAAEPEVERYDLGQRLIQMERAWDAHLAVDRARAMPVLKLAVPQLLAGKTAEAAATLDRVRLLLQSKDPTAAESWAASLIVHPEKRFIESNEGLAVRVFAAYSTTFTPPKGARLRLRLMAADGMTVYAHAELDLTVLPAGTALAAKDLPEGDHVLRAEVVVDGKVLATYSSGVSAAPRLRERLLVLLRSQQLAGKTIDVRTLETRAVHLSAMSAHQYEPETNYPAARLLTETEALAKAVETGKQFYGPQRTGQFWLTIPTGTASTPVRLFVPDTAKAGKPLPLVVALHGAGGSENLFFDAYGYGLIGRLAQERGWMVVAPRAGWLFDGPPSVSAIVDELAKLYPVDKKRVYLVGHSMGAMQAVTLAQQEPGRYAAIAALGGGGAVTKPEALTDLPVYVGCGLEDFLLAGAKGLAWALEKAGARRVTFKMYPGVEHMLIVQEALPDVFKFFERAVSTASEKPS